MTFIHWIGLLLLFAFGFISNSSSKYGAHAQTDQTPLTLNSTDFYITARQGRRSNALADSCLTNDGNSGTCMSRFKCMRQGGTSNGFCGTYGVCCETNMQCGQTSRLKRTIIKNPAVINMDLCQYTIEAFSPSVRQLRIDFEHFELQQPMPDPTNTARIECTDYFMAGDFILCGENTGQHLYLPFNVAAGIETITLDFNIPTRWAQSNWRLVVTQIEAPIAKRKTSGALGAFGAPSSNLQDLRTIFSTHHADYDLLAPSGCDQYYTEVTQNIKSFNYQSTGSNYMPELRYTICIKPTQGASMIEYTFNKFNLAIQVGTDGYDETCHPTVHTVGRAEDYLMIPQSYLVRNNMLTGYQPTYYCGLQDNIVVWAYPPFYMHFGSDDLVLDPTKETGFSLTYRVKSSMI